MKNTKHTYFAGFSVLVALVISGQAAQMVMRDASTHEELSLALRKADQMDPMKKMAAAKGGDPSVVNRPKDLLSDSDIISFGGIATLVPKRAILQIPKTYAEHIKMEPGARIVSWADFYAANRGWINTIEVSRVQAEGNKPIAEETQKFMGKCRNLVVATYQGGPISVLPPKDPPKDPATDASKDPQKTVAQQP